FADFFLALTDGKKTRPELASRAHFGRVKKRPTVGRRKNLLWVVSTTYGASVRRPTVGRFYEVSGGGSRN
ncbi:hypothetical protein, partial [uncultured Porphyromonas sp.]|uniref:hypothetical protein n=1 Tax=uncultured Porphyromonas sp. TaxID=159274 RepID=UPI00260ED41B